MPSLYVAAEWIWIEKHLFIPFLKLKSWKLNQQIYIEVRVHWLTAHDSDCQKFPILTPHGSHFNGHCKQRPFNNHHEIKRFWNNFFFIAGSERKLIEGQQNLAHFENSQKIFVYAMYSSFTGVDGMISKKKYVKNSAYFTGTVTSFRHTYNICCSQSVRQQSDVIYNVPRSYFCLCQYWPP